MSSQLYQNIIDEFKQLNFNDKLDLITDLIQLIKQSKNMKNKQLSAETKAKIRLKDELSPKQWITVISENEDIDEQALNTWVKNRV